jgi:integrase
MGRRFDNNPRVRGPYWSKAKERWYAQVLNPAADDPGRRRIDRWLGDDKREAQDWIDDARSKLVRLGGTTVDGALNDYRDWLVKVGHKKPNKAEAADERMRRLRLFFESVLDKKVASLTEEKAGDLYHSFAARTYTVGPKNRPREKQYAPAHHRHTLLVARSFLRWCVKPAKLIASNPLEDVQGFGERDAGKEQLTGDEAIRFYEWCAYKAHRGDEAAIGLLMLLMMALRQGDVVNRVVRDVDLGGARLVIGVGSSARSKTKRGDRGRKVPTELQPLLAKLAEGRDPLEPLFKAEPQKGDTKPRFHCDSWLRAATHRFCEQAGVPYVTPHGLKSTAGELATDSGALAEQVAAFLSHESKRTTQGHYVERGAMESAAAAAGLKVMQGGKR